MLLSEQNQFKALGQPPAHLSLAPSGPWPCVSTLDRVPAGLLFSHSIGCTSHRSFLHIHRYQTEPPLRSVTPLKHAFPSE